MGVLKEKVDPKWAKKKTRSLTYSLSWGLKGLKYMPCNDLRGDIGTNSCIFLTKKEILYISVPHKIKIHIHIKQ